MNSGSKPVTRLISRWLLRKTAPAAVRRIASLSAALATDVGNVRSENQDRVAVLRGVDRAGSDFAVLALADGIGSMKEGATCAALTIGSFFEGVVESASSAHSPSRHWLQQAAFDASRAVHSRFRSEGGATLVALLLRQNERPCWLSVGDSRVYRQDGKKVTQVSIDDTIAGQLGKGDAAEVEQSKLLQFIGMEGELEPHVADLEGAFPESILLTSDGVHFLSHASSWFGHLIVNAGEPGLCVKRLIDLAKWCGGPDNASAVVVRLPYEVQAEEPAAQCLEVWDAFGELQIALPPSAARTLAQAGGGALQEPPPLPIQAVPETVQSNGPKATKPSKVQRKPVTKKRKSPNPAKGKQLSAEGEAIPPELFVDFPENSK